MTRRTLFHVSASANRDSIRAHGLDPRLMGPARGIAGSERRELDGVFVCHDRDEAKGFVDMGLRRVGAVDLWEIDDPGSILQTNTAGYEYLPVAVPPARVRLAESFGGPPLEPEPMPAAAQLTAAVDLGAFEQVLQLLAQNSGTLFRYSLEPVEIEEYVPSPSPPGVPLPPELAEDLALALRDVDGEGVLTRGWTGSLESELPERDAEAEWDDETDYVWIDLRDARSVRRCTVVVPLGPTAAARRAGLAASLQQQFIEFVEVDGTLHPPCVEDHPHAAVAAVRGGAAWWVCPADGRAVAAVGFYAR